MERMGPKAGMCESLPFSGYGNWQEPSNPEVSIPMTSEMEAIVATTS